MINKLQSSILVYEKENTELVAAFFTDRRYYRSSYEQSRGRNSISKARTGRYFVYNKEDYRS